MKETRILLAAPGHELRLEKRDGSDDPQIVGYAAKFNTEAEIYDQFFESIAPGAFSDSISADDIRCLFNHDPNYVLGRTKSGTLSLCEDSVGLRTMCNPPATQQARDICESIRRGDVSGMSFTFDVLAQSWRKADDGSYHRTLQTCKLYDVGPVTFPAYDTTEVAMRSADQVKESFAAWQAAEAENDTTPLVIARRRLELLGRR